VRGPEWLLSPWGSGFVYCGASWCRSWSRPSREWSAFEGDRELHHALRLPRCAAERCAALRAGDAPVPGYPGDEPRPRPDRRARRGADRPATWKPSAARCWSGPDRRACGSPSPRGARGSGMVCLAAADPPRGSGSASGRPASRPRSARVCCGWLRTATTPSRRWPGWPISSNVPARERVLMTTLKDTLGLRLRLLRSGHSRWVARSTGPPSSRSPRSRFPPP
jgi:hypothetical protein